MLAFVIRKHGVCAACLADWTDHFAKQGAGLGVHDVLKLLLIDHELEKLSVQCQLVLQKQYGVHTGLSLSDKTVVFLLRKQS